MVASNEKNRTFQPLFNLPPLPPTAPLVLSDDALQASDYLSREELLRRRSKRAKQLARYYADQYWALMEQVKVRYREYVWRYGRSAVKAKLKGKKVDDLGFKVCLHSGCKVKAMPLSGYCYRHILEDRQQTLYKACTRMVRRGMQGPASCRKPVMVSAVPSLCSCHLQMAQTQSSEVLKKAGLNVSFPCIVAPKFHVIAAQYVLQIKNKRQKALRDAKLKVPDKLNNDLSRLNLPAVQNLLQKVLFPVRRVGRDQEVTSHCQDSQREPIQFRAAVRFCSCTCSMHECAEQQTETIFC